MGASAQEGYSLAIVSQEFLVLLPLRQAFVSSPMVVGNLGFGLELVHLERYRGMSPYKKDNLGRALISVLLVLCGP